MARCDELEATPDTMARCDELEATPDTPNRELPCLEACISHDEVAFMELSLLPDCVTLLNPGEPPKVPGECLVPPWGEVSLETFKCRMRRAMSWTFTFSTDIGAWCGWNVVAISLKRPRILPARKFNWTSSMTSTVDAIRRGIMSSLGGTRKVASAKTGHKALSTSAVCSSILRKMALSNVPFMQMTSRHEGESGIPSSDSTTSGRSPADAALMIGASIFCKIRLVAEASKLLKSYMMKQDLLPTPLPVVM
mmetsp:Transcript_42649/g.100022  ORF Transcript_42649/g.100022 Transcript_42649/m.100022 type:complete len:251 (-) Transcript_42649:2154-2906(-)